MSPFRTPITCAFLFLFVAQLPAQSEGEGPLRNDTFVPTNAAARTALDAGDALLARVAPEARERLAPERLAPIFDAWQRALVASETGDQVALAGEHQGLLPDPDASHERRTESVPLALRRRLEILTPSQLAAFQKRFDDTARIAWQDCGNDLHSLRRVAWEFPANFGAAAAELSLFDHEFETGRRSAARVHLERARGIAARLSNEDAALNSSIERRDFALQEYKHANSERDAAWRTAAALAPEGFHAFDLRSSRTPATARLAARGVTSRMAFLSDGSAVVHSPQIVRVLPIDGGERPFQPAVIVSEWAPPPRPSFASGGGSWPLAIDTTADRLTFVVGRAAGRRSNFLLCVEPPTEGAAPHVVWGLSASGLFGPPEDGKEPQIERPLGAGRWEFQPGSTVRDGELFVLARHWELKEIEDTGSGSDAWSQFGALAGGVVDESRAELWILCISHAEGNVKWRRMLARGSDIRLDLGNRFGSSSQVFRGATAPLVWAADRLFCDTGLGVVALVAPADGRVLWTLRLQRRTAQDAGWSATTSASASELLPGEAIVTSGPPDSDRLYWLRAGAHTGPLFAHPPRALGEAQLFVSGDADGALVLTRAGARRSLSRWGGSDGSRVDSLYLGRGERFRGTALVSEERVMFATDRALWLFDRDRELFLMDRETLLWPGKAFAPPGVRLGGSVFAHGGQIVVLGRAGLWRFRAVSAAELRGR